MRNRKKEPTMKKFAKDVAKGTAKGLGKLGGSAASGVASELFSIFTLGLYRPPRKKW